jgi:hypothetical protein
MRTRTDPPRTWTLNGATDNAHLTHRLAFLSSLFDTAKSKGSEVAQLRQRNLNFALIVFAAFISFQVRFPSGWYSVWASAAFVALMCFFSLLDRRFHAYAHGWRETEKLFMDMISSVINSPDQDITFVRFVREGKDKAEKFSLQPWITYLLVAGSLMHFVHCLVSAIQT